MDAGDHVSILIQSAIHFNIIIGSCCNRLLPRILTFGEI
jgi:hypothetical protein